MKLGSLKQGRDGRLVVVSDDLAWCADAAHIAPTLQAALDDWDRLAPSLELLATDLGSEVIPMMRFHERSAAAPLPARLPMGRRLGYVNQSSWVRRRAAPRWPESFWNRPTHVPGR
jgi:fumarylacetoacetate (FAA) hydrolase